MTRYLSVPGLCDLGADKGASISTVDRNAVAQLDHDVIPRELLRGPPMPVWWVCFMLQGVVYCIYYIIHSDMYI